MKQTKNQNYKNGWIGNLQFEPPPPLPLLLVGADGGGEEPFGISREYIA